MMNTLKLLAISLALAGCTKAPSDTPSTRPGLAKPEPAPTTPAATVTLMSVEFADDCGGTPPWSPPAAAAPASPPAPATTPAPATRVAPAPGKAARSAEESFAPGDAARRRCEQTSMQLAIAAAQDANVQVKSVEVFDDKGVSLGVLAATKPTRWIDASATYEPWNESVAAGQTAQVSYVLQQPSFVSHDDPRDRTYTVKVVASVGGVDQPLQTTVMVVGRRPAVPT